MTELKYFGQIERDSEGRYLIYTENKQIFLGVVSFNEVWGMHQFKPLETTYYGAGFLAWLSAQMIKLDNELRLSDALPGLKAKPVGGASGNDAKR